MGACPPNKLLRSLFSKIKTMLRYGVQCLVVVVVFRLLLTTVYKTREVTVRDFGVKFGEIVYKNGHRTFERISTKGNLENMVLKRSSTSLLIWGTIPPG